MGMDTNKVLMMHDLSAEFTAKKTIATLNKLKIKNHIAIPAGTTQYLQAVDQNSIF